MKYLIHFMQILEGWTKYILSAIGFYINNTANKRLEICEECEFSKNGICLKCGCVLKAKTQVNYLLDENGKSIGGCPDNPPKW